MTPSERRHAIERVIDQVSNPQDLNDTYSSAFMALDWIAHEDTYQLCPGDPSLVQRYVLSLFYFQTQGNQWTQCSNPSAFVPLTNNNATSNDTITNNIATPCDNGQPFLSSSSECQWGGITCNGDGQVFYIELSTLHMRGLCLWETLSCHSRANCIFSQLNHQNTTIYVDQYQMN
jgi:hypothetical protein